MISPLWCSWCSCWGSCSAHLVVLLLLNALACAQESSWVIGVLMYGGHNRSTLTGFQQALDDYARHQNQSVRYIDAQVIDERAELEPAMRRILSEQPDLIFTCTTPASQVAQSLTRTVPIIFAPVQDPVDAGLVESIRRPGGNCTGIRLTDSTAKQLQWFLRLAPTHRRIILPYSPQDASARLSYHKSEAVAAQFDITLTPWPLTGPDAVDRFLQACPTTIDGIFLPRDGCVMARVADFAALTRQRGLVLSGTRLEMVERGALFSFGFIGKEMGAQAGRLATRILGGLDPATMPVETAEDYLAINLQTARELGLTIPDRLLRQAHILIHPSAVE